MSALTSRPSPPLLNSTIRSTYSGNWYANCMTTPPPSECPTNVAFSIPSACSTSRSHVANAPVEWSLRNRVDPPCPARSGATTSYASPNRSSTGDHSELSPAMPWTRTTTSRPLRPPRRKAAVRPWTVIVDSSVTSASVPGYGATASSTRAFGVPARPGDVSADAQTTFSRKPLKAAAASAEAKVELDKDVLAIVDRLVDALRGDAGLTACFGETLKGGQPDFEIRDWVLDMQCGHGRLSRWRRG